MNEKLQIVAVNVREPNRSPGRFDRNSPVLVKHPWGCGLVPAAEFLRIYAERQLLQPGSRRSQECGPFPEFVQENSVFGEARRVCEPGNLAGIVEQQGKWAFKKNCHVSVIHQSERSPGFRSVSGWGTFLFVCVFLINVFNHSMDRQNIQSSDKAVIVLRSGSPDFIGGVSWWLIVRRRIGW